MLLQQKSETLISGEGSNLIRWESCPVPFSLSWPCSCLSPHVGPLFQVQFGFSTSCMHCSSGFSSGAQSPDRASSSPMP